MISWWIPRGAALICLALCAAIELFPRSVSGSLDEPSEVLFDFAKLPGAHLPEPFISVALTGERSRAFSLVSRGNTFVLSNEPSTGGDVLYYKRLKPLASLEETYAFVYTGPGSVVEPFIVNGQPRHHDLVEGFTTDLSAAAPGNTAAGTISYHYSSDNGALVNARQGRLRTEPYFYQVGHTYRVDAIADGLSGLLTTGIYDELLGPQALDTSIVKWNVGRSLYPGFVAKQGPVTLLDFAFGSPGNLPVMAHPARRGADYMNYLGYNGAVRGPQTRPLSREFQRYFPELLIKHLRMRPDPSLLPTINALANEGIDADVVTGRDTKVSMLRRFVSALSLPPDSIELWNEPNHPCGCATYDPDYEIDLPGFAASVSRAFPNTKLWGPSIVPESGGSPPDVQTVTGKIKPLITAWNAHSYALGTPENLGIGGFFAHGCGRSYREECGWYGSAAFFDNTSAIMNPSLPGVTTEGAASYGTYPDICGKSMVDFGAQQAYVERGMFYNFLLGHLRIFPYTFNDQGGCSDGFGTYGIMSLITDSDGEKHMTPKPAYVSLVYLDHLLADEGVGSKTFAPQPLSYRLGHKSAHVEELLLAETDKTYRLILWTDGSLWEFHLGEPALGSPRPIISESVSIDFAMPTSTTVYTQTPGVGRWQVISSGRSLSTKVLVNQYPLVVSIAPGDSGDSAVVLPEGVPTPGPTETPTAGPLSRFRGN